MIELLLFCAVFYVFIVGLASITEYIIDGEVKLFKKWLLFALIYAGGVFVIGAFMAGLQ